MSRSLKAYALLLRIKRRRVEQLEAAVQEQAGVVAAAKEQLGYAQANEAQAQADQQACADKIDHLTSGAEGFLPSKLVTLNHVLDGLKLRSAEAQKATAQAQQAVEQAEAQWRELRRAVDRANNQVEQIEEQRKKLAKEIEDAAEDQQDEDSEEAAVARLIAQVREAEYELAKAA